jgi:hypothetical protein
MGAPVRYDSGIVSIWAWFAEMELPAAGGVAEEVAMSLRLIRFGGSS